MNEKSVQVRKTVEQTRKTHTVEKKIIYNKPERPISTGEKDQRKPHLHDNTYGKIWNKTKRKLKERNCRSFTAPNRNPNHKCSARMSTCHEGKKKEHFAKACRFDN